VLHLTPRPHVVALSLEHLICDGIAFERLIEEVNVILAPDGAAPLPAASSYVSYSEEQRAALGP